MHDYSCMIIHAVGSWMNVKQFWNITLSINIKSTLVPVQIWTGLNEFQRIASKYILCDWCMNRVISGCLSTGFCRSP